MGHADEAITAAVYTHEIERRNNREKTRATMGLAFGRGTVPGTEAWALTGNAATLRGAEVAEIHAVGH